MKAAILVLLTLSVAMCQDQKLLEKNFCNGTTIDISCPTNTVIRIKVTWYIYVHSVWDAKDCEKHFNATIVCYRKMDIFHEDRHKNITEQCEGNQQCGHIIAHTDFNLKCFNYTSPAEYMQIMYTCEKENAQSSALAMFPTSPVMLSTTQQPHSSSGGSYTSQRNSYITRYHTTPYAGRTSHRWVTWNPYHTTTSGYHHGTTRTSPSQHQTTSYQTKISTFRPSFFTTSSHTPYTYTTTRRRIPLYTGCCTSTPRHPTSRYHTTSRRPTHSTSTTTSTAVWSATGTKPPPTPRIMASTTHVFEAPGLHVRASGDTLKMIIAVPIAACVLIFIIVTVIVCFVYKRKRLTQKNQAPQSSVMYLRNGARVPGTGTGLDTTNFVLENEVRIGPILVMETDQGCQTYCLTARAPSAARLAQVHTKVLTDNFGAVGGGVMVSGKASLTDKVNQLEDVSELEDIFSYTQDVVSDTEPLAEQEFSLPEN